MGVCDLVFQVQIVMCFVNVGLFAIYFYIIWFSFVIIIHFFKLVQIDFILNFQVYEFVFTLILEFSSSSCELGNTLWICILIQIDNWYVVYIDHTKDLQCNE